MINTQQANKGNYKRYLYLVALGIATVSSLMMYSTFKDQQISLGQLGDQDSLNLAHSKHFGGNGGSSFAEHPHGQMETLIIRHGKYIDSIGAKTNGKTTKWGRNGGGEDKIDTRNVCINHVTVRSGKWVDALTFRGYYIKGRNKGHSWSSKQYGGIRGGEKSVKLDGCLNGFFGRAGKYIDRIGFISSKEITDLRGKWNMVESYSGDINYYIEEKTVRESSKAMDKREATQYSVSSSVKGSFMGIGASVDTSFANQKYLAQQFKDYQYNSKLTKQKRVCKKKDKGQSAQVWQFELRGFANDGKSIDIKTRHFICTSSKNTHPKCIPELCANDVCTKCKR